MQDLTDRKSDWLHDRKPFKQKTKKKKSLKNFSEILLQIHGKETDW